MLKKKLILVSIAAMSMSLIACNGLKSVDSVSNNTAGVTDDGGASPTTDYLLSVGVEEKMKEVEAQKVETENTMNEAVEVFNKIVNEDGSLNLDIGIFSEEDQVRSQFNLFDPLGIAKELRPILNQVLEKVRMVPDQIAEAKEKIIKTKEELDPNHPEYDQLISELDKMLAQIAEMEAQLDEMLAFLVDKIDWAMEMFDTYIAKIPVAWGRIAAEIALAELKQVILDFRNTLATL